MINKVFKVLVVCCLTSLTSCSQKDESGLNETVVVADKKDGNVQSEPHMYGGWYCPDNLNGFPAVDLRDWKDVPIVKGRMPTKEETQNGTSLIFVDSEKYPNAKPLDIALPQLASIYNEHTRRKEVIIIIQALNINNDSIFGFRYLNGGNGSARYNEVRFVDDTEIEILPASRFVSQDLEVKARKHKIWDILINPDQAAALQPIFDANHSLKADWRVKSKVNFDYLNSGNLTAAFAGDMYGNYYIQNDYDQLGYSEKFLLLENEDTGHTELKIVAGPYGADFEIQKEIIDNWAQKVKELSEKK